MARVYPNDYRQQKLALGSDVRRGIAREYDTLELLAEGLSDDFTIFHGCHWTRHFWERGGQSRLRFIEHYEDLDIETKQLLPLKRMYWPV